MSHKVELEIETRGEGNFGQGFETFEGRQQEREYLTATFGVTFEEKETENEYSTIQWMFGTKEQLVAVMRYWDAVEDPEEILEETQMWIDMIQEA